MVPAVSVPPCLANGNSLPVMQRQCYRVTFPQLEFHPAHSKRIAATRYHHGYMVTTGFRLRWSHKALLPAGYLPNIPIVSLILFLMPVVTLFALSTLFAEPKVDTALAKKH